MTAIRVLSVASEVYPLVKTGGLGDVVAALPAALAHEGIAMRTLVPGYPAVLEALHDVHIVHTYANLYGAAARLLRARAAGLELFVIDAPRMFARAGTPYADESGTPWSDNAFRFAALAAAAVSIARGAAPDFVPDVVQAHDWQAGLVPALLHYGEGPRPATVMTIHNLAFQGQYPREWLAALGLPPRAWAMDGVEYYGTIGFLKAGVALADRITTVSPTYAAEIRTQEGGMGMDGLLRERAHVLTGIRNGIDDTVWNPGTDTHLAARYDARHLGRRSPNKAALQARFALDVDPDAPVFGVVSRLTHQKGMDLVADVVPHIVASGAQLAVLGSGDPALENRLTAAATRHDRRVAAVIGYDEALAHLLQAGIDALLVPSRFEPCGLTQLVALRYGALPVVARVGGLADTVIDANEMALAADTGTGFQFAPVSRSGLALAIGRALAARRDTRTWRRLQAHAMATDVGWRAPAKRYAELFRDVAKRHPTT
ncbi:MAG: glycogen synthase GlgA [Betaproteobacteria bacterium]